MTKSQSWVRQTELERIFNSHRYQVKNMLSIVSSILHCLQCVLLNATCEREIFKLFPVSKCKGFYSLKLEKNTVRKILKLNTFHLVEKMVRLIFMQTVDRKLGSHFSQTCEFWSSEPNRRLRFSLLSIILTDLLRNKTLLHGFKRSWFVIRGFRSVLCVSRFQGSLLVIVIMIDGSDKHNCEGGF